MSCLNWLIMPPAAYFAVFNWLELLELPLCSTDYPSEPGSQKSCISCRQPVKQSLFVPSAAVQDPQLLATIRYHHICWPHWQCRAGWICTGLSGNVFTSLLIHGYACNFFAVDSNGPYCIFQIWYNNQLSLNCNINIVIPILWDWYRYQYIENTFWFVIFFNK